MKQSEIHVAAVGDVHGHMDAMVALLQQWERRSGVRLDLVLQVGDFECHRDDADLASMAVPSRYRPLGDFPDFHAGRAAFPWRVVFIGGNHEPYAFLDPVGSGPVTHNCDFLGRAECIEFGGLRIAGLSGIHCPDFFAKPRPSVEAMNVTKKKLYTFFTKEDVDALANCGNADILLLHEWPQGVIASSDEDEFEQQRRSMRYDVVGNEWARLLMEVLEPRLVLCGHMHKRYRNRVILESGKITQICCLSNVASGADSIAVFRVSAEGIIEVTA